MQLAQTTRGTEASGMHDEGDSAGDDCWPRREVTVQMHFAQGANNYHDGTIAIKMHYTRTLASECACRKNTYMEYKITPDPDITD